MVTSASSRRRSDEEVPVHGGPDPGHCRRRGGRIGRARGLSLTRHQFGHPYYQSRSTFAGMSANELKRVKELEAENARLKKA